MPETTGKMQRIYEEITVNAVPLLIILVVIGALWTFADEATPKNLLAEFLGSGGVLNFFKNLPSDGLKVLLIGLIITGSFAVFTIVSVTAKEGRRFWYKMLFRKEPP